MADAVTPATDAVNPGADDLLGRLEYVSEQARINGGWSKMLVEERDRITGELDRQAKAEDIDLAAHAAASSPLNDKPHPTEAPVEQVQLARQNVADSEKDALFRKVVRI